MENLTNQEPQEQAATADLPTGKEEIQKEIKDFFKKSLTGMLKTYFVAPLTGTYNLFKEADNRAYFNSLVLIVTTSVLYMIVPYILLGSARDYIEFSTIIKVGLSIGLLLVIISAISFGVKSIAGKPDFKKELLTGALCGIPLVVLLAIMILAKLFVSNMDITDMMNPSAYGNLKLLALPALYVPFWLINTILQSFRASNVNETLAWYASPIVIGLAVYITQEVVVKSFF